MNRKKEFFLTVVSNLTLQIVTAVCGFILPPLIVGVFGSETNGMVSSITQFIAYLNLVEAGIGAASIAALYKPLAENDVPKVNGILTAARRFYFRSGVLFSLGIVILAFLYPLVIGNQVDKVTSFLMVLVLGISGSAEFFLIGKYRVLLTSDKKLFIISFLQSIAVVINTVVATILIKCGFGIVVVKFVSSLIYLSKFIVLYFYVKRKYKDFTFYSEPDTKAIEQSKNALVHQVSAFIVFNSPVIILTIFCDLKEVSVYSIYTLVFTAVYNLVGSFSTGVQSFFGESMVKDSSAKVRKFYSNYETLFFSVMFWLYACTYILIIPFMTLYTRQMSDVQYIRPELAGLMVVSGVLSNLRNPGGQLINAVGHFKQTQGRSIAEGIINIFASVFFTLKFGILGVVLGNIVSSIYRGIDVVVYTNRHILKQKNFLSFAKILIFAIVFFILSIFFMKLPFDFSSWTKWIFNAFIVTIVSSLPVIFIFVYLKKKKVEL